MKDSIYSRDDITRRVRALLAKAEKAGSKQEAAAFAAAASRMILEYNLKDYELNKKPISSQNIEYVMIEKKRKWHTLLLTGVAEGNFCKCYLAKSVLYVFGEKHNLQIVKDIYEYLTAELQHLAQAGYYEYQMSGARPLLPGAPWKQNFYMGAANTIYTRLQTQLRALKGEVQDDISGPGSERLEEADRPKQFSHDTANARALVVVHTTAIEEKAKQMFGGIEEGKKNYYQFRPDQAGYREGREAGKTVSINKMID